MGPLQGIRIVEIAGIGPGPFCAMMLSDMGADIIRVDRQQGSMSMGRTDFLNRGRKSIALDLKKPEGVETIQQYLILKGINPRIIIQGWLFSKALSIEEIKKLPPGIFRNKVASLIQDKN